MGRRFDRAIRIRGDDCREYHLEGYGSASRVKSIVETADGTIWVGTVSGLQRMPRASRDTRTFRARPGNRQHRPRAAGGPAPASSGSAPSAMACCAIPTAASLTSRRPTIRPAAPCWRSSTTTNRTSGPACRPVCCASAAPPSAPSRCRTPPMPTSERCTPTRTARCGSPAPTCTASMPGAIDSELVPPPAPGIRVRSVISRPHRRALDRHRRRRRLPLAERPAGAVHQAHRPGERFRPRLSGKPRRQRLDRHRRGHHPLARRRAHQLPASRKAWPTSASGRWPKTARGDIWIGTERGVSHWRNGALRAG